MSLSPSHRDTMLHWLSIPGFLVLRCQVFIIVQGWPACVAVWLVQLILQMRLYALYNKSRKLVMFTGALYIAEIIAMSGILLKANLVVHTSNQPLPGIYICSATDTPRVFYSFWIPPLVYEAVLCSLAIWIGVKRSREYIRPVHVQGHGMRLVDVVVMGNVLYFFGLLLSFATSAAMWQALGPEWIEVPEGFPQASEIIAGCRLILHIRNAGSPIDNTTKTSTSTQVVVHYPMQRLSRGLVLDEA
ncbi:hypothetical protein BS17DRAFT_249080 [Gyrodon lividus]|nr:hypothetical protein BS17DRAFT_249080 [Gyrodon lividus]